MSGEGQGRLRRGGADGEKGQRGGKERYTDSRRGGSAKRGETDRRERRRESMVRADMGGTERSDGKQTEGRGGLT